MGSGPVKLWSSRKGGADSSGRGRKGVGRAWSLRVSFHETESGTAEPRIAKKNISKSKEHRWEERFRREEAIQGRSQKGERRAGLRNKLEKRERKERIHL